MDYHGITIEIENDYRNIPTDTLDDNCGIASDTSKNDCASCLNYPDDGTQSRDLFDLPPKELRIYGWCV
jgi:hypothetical protein